MFEGLLNIARSMTKNITCSVQDASVLQGFDAELVDMTLEAAKAIADKPRPSPSPEAPGLPVRSDHILIDILIHLTQNVAEPRIIVFEHIWTHRVQDAFACLVILDSVTRYQCCVWCSAAEKLTPESCCKPRHSPEQTCRFFSNVSNFLASNRCYFRSPQTGAVALATKHGPLCRPHTVDRLRIEGARANAKSVWP